MHFALWILRNLSDLLFVFLILRLSDTRIGVATIEIPCGGLVDVPPGFCRPAQECKHLMNKVNAYKDPPPSVKRLLHSTWKACEDFNNMTGLTTFCCRRRKPLYPCGEDEINRISFGKDSKLLEFPWIARIVEDDGVTESDFCAGTLIDLNHVLTAGHCTMDPKNKATHVVLGDHDTSRDKDCSDANQRHCAPPPQKIRIVAIIKHENYEQQQLNNDLALLRLEHPVNISVGNALPICLPTSETRRPNSMLAAGWGVVQNKTKARILQKANVELTSLGVCPEKRLCTNSNSSTCQGDSGGPLFGKVNMGEVSRYYQFGVTSYGHKHCGSGPKSIFVDLSEFMVWIYRNVHKSVNHVK